MPDAFERDSTFEVPALLGINHGHAQTLRKRIFGVGCLQVSCHMVSLLWRSVTSHQDSAPAQIRGCAIYFGVGEGEVGVAAP